MAVRVDVAKLTNPVGLSSMHGDAVRHPQFVLEAESRKELAFVFCLGRPQFAPLVICKGSLELSDERAEYFSLAVNLHRMLSTLL
jgi:hypothetical protein